MRTERFRAFADFASADYARANVGAGRWAEGDALAQAQAELEALLPKGIATPDHFLYEIVPPEIADTAGYVWFATLKRGSRRVAHVYQLAVLPPFRRRGYARAALQEAEAIARQAGHAAMSLNV